MIVPGSVNPLLLKSAAAAGGLQVSRSLRYSASDSSYLSRTPASTTTSERRTWTFSFWIKRTKAGTEEVILDASASGQYPQGRFEFANNDTLNFFWYDGSTVYSVSTAAVYRDFSAWYHMVLAFDSTQATASNRTRLYVNGIEQTLSGSFVAQNTNTDINNTVKHVIGYYQHDSNYYTNSYLADVYMIAGQQLDPSAFTTTDATTGQLIPKAFSGSYGTNGFHLTFADNSSNTASTLGKDTSPNGNNWTPNNFSVTGGNGNYVKGVTGAQTTGEVAANLFDGNTGTYCSASTSGGTVTVTFTPSLSVTTSTRVFNGSSTLNVAVNGGTAVNYTGAGWKNVSFTGSLSSISFTHGGGAIGSLTAIEIDGVILLDNGVVGPGNDSLVDSPTNYGTDTGVGGEVRGNYCTLNPLAKGGDIQAPTNGNLQVTSSGSGYGLILGTIGVSTGKWYWEVTTTSANCATGIATNRADLANYGGADAYSWVWASYSGGSNKRNNNSASSYGSILANGDVVGIAFDADSGTLTFYKNGVSQGNAYTGIAAGTYLPVLGDETSGANIDLTANFGQRAFAYTAPSGFKALCTQNLPAPLVTKPSDLFDVKLYTGNGGTQSITGLAFNPDFVWIKNRSSGSNHHIVFDAVRGVSAVLYPSFTNSEFVNTGNGVTSFNSGGFTVVDDTSGLSNVNGSVGGTYSGSAQFVGWCWDAGTSTVSNTQGSITSQVRANATAGFSVATWTGTGSGSATVGHGLGVAPRFFIVKDRSNARNWLVYHTSIGPTGGIQLNLTTQAGFDGNYWNNTAPTSTVATIGTYGNESANYVGYFFSSVVGYSNFGSYTGNGSSDGPFVYTGFRPRFVLAKRTDNTGDWFIWDAARVPYNQNASILWANSSNAETTSSSYGIDFLSNGFKLTGGSSNSNFGTLVYAAFAEAPFNYSRAR